MNPLFWMIVKRRLVVRQYVLVPISLVDLLTSDFRHLHVKLDPLQINSETLVSELILFSSSAI